MSRCACVLAALLALLLWPGAASADALQPGYLEITQRDAQRWARVIREQKISAD